jgi:mannosyltransferase OCH1-like enzyme
MHFLCLKLARLFIEINVVSCESGGFINADCDLSEKIFTGNLSKFFSGNFVSRLGERTMSRDIVVPSIIHQTWRTADIEGEAEEPFRTYALQSQKSWKRYHPDFDYMFWTDEDMDQFVETHYAWFYTTWKSFDVHIKRVDTARYCWLHFFGGIYCDLDMICKKSVSPLLAGFDVFSYKTRLSMRRGVVFAGNAWMASVKGHPLWIEMLHYTKNYSQQLTERPADVLDHTGPRALGAVFNSYLKENPGSKIKVWGPDLIGNEDEPPCEYAYHGRTHTWNMPGN